MKTTTLLSLIIALMVTGGNAFGQTVELQESPTAPEERISNVEVNSTNPYTPLYVISDKELPSYFTNGKIPTTFPKYDANLTKTQNQKIALEWLSVPTNRSLLTEGAKKTVDQKTRQFQTKHANK